MAYITIKSNADEDSMTLRESVLPSDLESEFFCNHLVERLHWAVEDAHAPPVGAALTTTADEEHVGAARTLLGRVSPCRWPCHARCGDRARGRAPHPARGPRLDLAGSSPMRPGTPAMHRQARSTPTLYEGLDSPLTEPRCRGAATQPRSTSRRVPSPRRSRGSTRTSTKGGTSGRCEGPASPGRSH